jgi:aspartyl-tRNA(Asn)/glutamyl-tRNA(Gln) amidotransferase subunit C
MSLANDDVRRIAALARIAITAEESAQVLERLNRVLALIDEMRAVDVSGVEPMAHAQQLGQRLREDKVTDSDQHALYQSVAPAVEDDLYLVPKVIE